MSKPWEVDGGTPGGVYGEGGVLVTALITVGDQGGKLGGPRGGVTGAEDEASGMLDGREQDGSNIGSGKVF